MRFADKLVELRKNKGISQEELADKLDVTRQSISKWESGQSIPDISRILQLSELFDVSVDYLLKDEIELDNVSQQSNKEDNDIIKVGKEEADKYIEHSKYLSKIYSIATVLCILSPMLLMIFVANPGLRVFSDAVSIIVGILGLLIFVSCGVAMFIYSSFKNQPYKYLDEQDIVLDNNALNSVKQSKESALPKFARNIILGVVLCIFAIVPIIIFALLLTDYIGLGVCIALVFVVIAVALFVNSGTQWGAFQKLLAEGDYSKEGKKASKLTEKIASIYWLTVLAIYLLISFVSNNWARSWIIWPVCAVLFVIISVVVEAVVGSKKIKNK